MVDIRHGVSTKCVSKIYHDIDYARPVVAAFGFILVSENDGNAEVALGGVIPLLVLRSHDELSW